MKWIVQSSSQRSIQTAILLSAAVSFSVVFGLLTHRPVLTRWVPDAPAMVLETAIAMIIASSGFWCAHQRRRHIVRWTSVALLLIGVSRFVELNRAHDLKWLSNPGMQTAPGTAAALILLGIGLLLLSRNDSSLRTLWVGALIGTIVASIGLITLLGYASGLSSAPWWVAFSLEIAIPTAVICCLLGISLIVLFFQRTHRGAQQLSITAAILAIIGLLILFAGVDTAVLASSTSILTTRTEIRKAGDAIRSVQALVESARKAESGQRGYLLTGDREYLKTFNLGEQAFARIARERSDQDARLVKTIQLEFDELHRTILLETQGRHGEALRLITASQELRLMEEIEAQAKVISDQLQRERVLHLAASRQSVLAVRKLVFWSYGLAVGFAAGSLLLIRLAVRRRARTEEHLREKEATLAAMNNALRDQSSRAEEASLAKSNFLASMSHEIRTPMNAILGMADMLWESELSQTQRHYVEVFRRAGGNLLTLINDILDLSKIESGNFRLEEVEFDLQDTVEHLLEILTPKAESKNISLLAHIESGTTTNLLGDPARLQQVLLNLLGNAIKFTDQGDVLLRVRSQSTPTHANLQFEVSDSGIGIPEDKLSSIFDDFTQAESSTTRRFGGTGLGLGITRRLVRYMGGEVGVRSEPGRGSTFFFNVFLPIGVEQRISAPVHLDEIAGKHVLVVDNNAVNRIILGEMCAAWGLVVTCCSSGAEAVNSTRISLQSHPFALALVDRMMPGIDGFETARQMRLLDPHISILIVSSDSQAGDISRCRELGFSGHIMKPVRRAELLHQIIKALSEVSEPASEMSIGESPKTSVNTERRVRVLVAEDSEDNRFLLQAYCKGTVYDLTFAEDGERALAAYRSGSFSLVIMDVQMPVMDGLTAIREIRRSETAQGGPQIPILALTANALPQDVARALEAGCDAHVSKPISKKSFLSVIDRWQGASGLVKPSVIIDIPEGLEALARGYLMARERELSVIQRCLQSSGFDDVRRLAHQLKGSGTSFGFPDISRLGGIMEQAANDRNLSALTRNVFELSAYIEAANHEMESAVELRR